MILLARLLRLTLLSLKSFQFQSVAQVVRSGRGREAFSSISGGTLRKSRAFYQLWAPGPESPLDTRRVGMARRVLELKSYREVSPYLLKTSQKQPKRPYAFLMSIQGADLSQQFYRHGQTSRFQSDKCHCNAIL